MKEATGAQLVMSTGGWVACSGSSASAANPNE